MRRAASAAGVSRGLGGNPLKREIGSIEFLFFVKSESDDDSNRAIYDQLADDCDRYSRECAEDLRHERDTTEPANRL